MSNTVDSKRVSETQHPERNVVVKRTKITDFFSVKKKPAPPKDVSSTESKQTIKTVTTTTTLKLKPTQPAETAQQCDSLDEDAFSTKYNFNKKKWIESLSPKYLELLDLEINYLHISWLTFLHKELTKPYFLKLKRFLKAQAHKTVFPPKHQIYSWSHFTPLPQLKCLILGQDPYHNFNQAHGLAFSVLEPTKPPPSLKNIYKGIQNDYPKFEPPNSSQGGGGNLTKWAKRGVLMLNTCLTVEAHKANSHSKQGWETFTQEVINTAINYHQNQENSGFVVMAWGMPAQNTVGQFPNLQKTDNFLVLKTFHPSPFSAAKGFFTAQCFRKCNEWLEQQGKQRIDWALLDSNQIFT
ncbi:uracil DNA glycosylase [Yamadazyma tenuis]|uniref:Uracil-DNA glycosylase n=1 Tax=Candida tenuis (strain ATCC 10573 / BCRC 21748 / CBS 615 / JCM 9827 / NBRC 10315 / NRRL Y-1498 / VKM Y-70) TaxID=590646 RepID=G3BBN4_CANTC|nr:uncharacterized protein CANTEDRAFT_107512 [Yamadazyma tenuis ATCC 10573]EGV61580.1 hypothetical protein CANTEDRAFT_107512 [Yamadazyma tenuis ATCC 10573]WEJ92802.1 uracil DNA glycosylase [Yamadazyma tenuis]